MIIQVIGRHILAICSFIHINLIIFALCFLQDETSVDVTSQSCILLQPITVEYRNKCEFTIGIDPDGNGKIVLVFVSLEHEHCFEYQLIILLHTDLCHLT